MKQANPNQPIKIGFLISSLRTGGKEQISAAVIQGLDRQAFDPFLVVMKEGELLANLDDTRVYSNLARFRGDVLGFGGRLFGIMRRERPQILVILSYRLVGVLGRIIGRSLGVPIIIYELHGVERAGLKHLDPLDRLLDRYTDHMIAIGEDFRAALIAEGVTPQKISVIPNGVDTERFSPASDSAQYKADLLNFSADTLVMGCVAGLRPEKNLGLLLDGFALVHEKMPQVRLILIGEGRERPTLEAQSGALGLRAVVQFLGLRRDVPDLLRACDLAVLSSSTEAAPLAILEALACGLPVIAPRLGEIPQMIDDGLTGLLFPSGDAEALAAQLLCLLGDASLRREMGARARKEAVARFSLSASIASREALFKRLLAEKHPHNT